MNINNYLLEHQNEPYAKLAKATGLTENAVRGRLRRRGMKPRPLGQQRPILTPEKEIERDVLVETLGKKAKSSDEKYKLTYQQNEALKTQLEGFHLISGANTYTIPKKGGHTVGEATAVAVASDWHFAETVHGGNVNGLNEFNTTIAKERAEHFFRNVVRLTTIFRKDIRINTLVLALLGDFINGQLREEAMENNSLRPMDELIAVWRVIASGIKYILDNTDLNLVIPCHSGNHARISKKTNWSTESGNSLEYVMYQGLASEFKDNKRVTFIIPTSYLSYMDIAGFTIRFHHGHAVKYGGGIGGVFIPAFKSISQWDKARRADLTVFGHFHQSKDGGNFLCNGSLIGFNEYAVSIKADFEKPKQTFFLVDHRRKEKTLTTPIFLDETH